MDVAVRELKARLSAYLRRAEAGQMITVTDRGRPIAVLGPVLERVELADAVAAGWLSPASRTGLDHVRRHPARRTVEDVLDEDRSG